MINNIQELRERLFTNRIVKNEQELQGCTSEKIPYIESKYGVFPRTYREILGLLGRSAGKLVRGSEFEFYFDQLIKINEWQREAILEFIAEGEECTPLPKNTFCICPLCFFAPESRHRIAPDNCGLPLSR